MMRMMMVVLLGLTLHMASARAEWTEDYAAAAKTAADGNKYMLLNFTGSDWCGWCIRLDKEVFSQPAFKEYANEQFVLVKLDFPRDRALSEDVVQQNRELQAKYGVRGYPTIIVLSPSGELAGQTGYRPGGPEAYVEHLKELIAGHASASATPKPAAP